MANGQENTPGKGTLDASINLPLWRDPRFFPPLLGLLLFGLTILGYRDIEGPFRNYLVSALVVYVLLSGIISSLHSTMAQRNIGTKGQLLTRNEVSILYGTHVIIFLGVASLFIRAVL